eukprot:m51a1_g11284 hypothetical protein (331) ;mRNA; r:25222-26866
MIATAAALLLLAGAAGWRDAGDDGSGAGSGGTGGDLAELMAARVVLVVLFALGLVHCAVSLAAHLGAASRWQKAFYLLLSAGLFGRTLFIGLLIGLVEESVSPYSYKQSYSNVVGTLPSFFFCTGYMILLFLWGDLWATRYNVRKIIFKKFFYVTNTLLYTVTGSLFIADLCTNTNPSNVWDEAAGLPPYEIALMVIDSFMYVPISVCFLVCGYIAFRQSAQPQMHTTLHSQVLKLISCSTMVCMILYLVRSVIVILSVLHPRLLLFWWFECLYYALFDLVPVVLMVSILNRSITLVVRDTQRFREVTEPLTRGYSSSGSFPAYHPSSLL